MECSKQAVRSFIGAIAFLTGNIVANPAFAASETPQSETLAIAESFILDTSRMAISKLKNGKDDRFALKQLFRSRFDYKLMGRYALGRYWEKANSNQKNEYHDLFAEYVPNGYMGQLKDYSGADIALVKSRSLRGGDSIVTTALAPKGGDTMVFDWRVRTDKEHSKVIDIVVGGVSYLKMLRQQFTAIAASQGIEGLLALLRKHAAANAATTGKQFRDLADKLRTTDAIDTATKFSLKTEVDDLVADLGRHHDGVREYDLESLKQRFDRLVFGVVAMLKTGDPSLAADMASMRPALWQALKDPKHFVVVALR